MNNAFLFVEAGREETNGSLMDLMRLGFIAERGGQPLALPARPPGKEAAVWKGAVGVL